MKMYSYLFGVGVSILSMRINNTGLVSVPFPPLPTGVWVGIVELYKWAAIGETLGQFLMGGGSK